MNVPVPSDKLHAALMELNELYTYFYSEDVINISVDEFLPLNIQKNTDINDKILNQIHRKGSKKDQVVGSKEVKENEQN